jgi:hypothetical protein
MAAGDLSPDQSSYVDRVASGTGLDRRVVVAWVGSESGWNVNKPGHNYLNVGPGETYPSVAQAAARVVGLIEGSTNYYGIRAAIPAGPAAQVQAIGQSKWGTNPTALTSVYSQLAGGSGPVVQPVNWLSDAAGAATGAILDPFGLLGAAGGAVGGAVAGAAGDVAGGVVGEVVKDLGPVLLEAGLTIVFTVAAFALLAMGINQLTGQAPKKIFDTVSGAASTAAGVAALA